MCSPGINGEGELRGQPANPGLPGKMAVKTECLCVCAFLGLAVYNLLLTAFAVSTCQLNNDDALHGLMIYHLQ